MNKTEKLEKKIEKLSKDLEELKCELDKEKLSNTQMNTRWRANNGETYYYAFGDGDIAQNREENGGTPTKHYNLGNYFQTKEEVEKVVEKIKIYIKLKDLALRLNKGEQIDWENRNQPKQYISFDNESNELFYLYCYTCHDIGQIYCLDKSFLDIAEQEIGEENLRKLFE